MDFITPEQMMLEEKMAVARGVSVLRMMERAGAGTAEVIAERFGPLQDKTVLVVCGTGNNGGDGFVTARYLQSKGASVTTLLLGAPERIRTEEARRNWDALGTNKVIAEGVEELAVVSDFEDCDIIVAALTGTGMKGEVKEPLRSAIERINSTRATKVAIDIPSGLDPYTGKAMPVAVRADITVALYKPKVGLKYAKEYTGEIVVVPIE